jgi:hypothetical protein
MHSFQEGLNFKESQLRATFSRLEAFPNAEDPNTSALANQSALHESLEEIKAKLAEAVSEKESLATAKIEAERKSASLEAEVDDLLGKNNF